MSQQSVGPHVFISHKSRDKNAAMALKQILLRSCSDLHVFVSSDAHDMPNGHEWRAEIHRNLEAAHWLILLYTDPTDNWDWCLYECGYHASRIRTGEPMSRKLTVLCPQGITPPAPLTEWQLTQSDLRAIDTLLQELGHCIRTDVTKLDDAKRMKLAREIKSLVDNLHVSYSQS